METVRIENCNEKSVIKVLPHARASINRNCEYVVEICHNITEKLNPSVANLVVYSQSIVIQNSTTAVDCRNYKKIMNREIVKMVSALSGLRECEKFKPGITCRNSTLFKLKDTLRSIDLIKQTTRDRDKYTIVQKIIFENGAESCIKSEAVSRKY